MDNSVSDLLLSNGCVMGLDIILEDENGKSIESVSDPMNILHRIFPTSDDISYHFLNSVDWCGDTVFNRLQIPGVRQELQRVISAARNDDEKALLKNIDQLAARCEAGGHLYLKFYGD